MQRGADPSSGGLGPQLVGEIISVNRRITNVVKQLGEGGFSFVYLVKDISEDDASGSHQENISQVTPEHLVLKITSIHSRQQRDIAEKEAKLLSRLSHPSIVRMLDSCYRSIPAPIPEEIHRSHMHMPNLKFNQNNSQQQSRPQHLILMEYCEGGTALSVCNNLKNNQTKFDIQSLIIAFGQICNAVSYLHAQRPPIVHRDLKPVNFLVKNGAYKVCDFGSAVFGHVDLRTSRARAEAEEVIQKTTTQMFRSPEMVDLYMAKKLTQSTDVWALGCCLYSLAFLQNCFEEGSNLAILSRNFKIPDNNPYGKDLAELIDRMLTVNCRERADMTEVILCLSAIYSGRPLPPRKKEQRIDKDEENKILQKERVGAFRTDGQGIRGSLSAEKKPAEAKKLNPNSAAARRRKAAQMGERGEGNANPVPFTRQGSKVRSSNGDLSAIPLTRQGSRIRSVTGENTAIPLTRISSKARKTLSNTNSFDQSFGDSFTTTTFKNDHDESGFSGADDPFHVGGGVSSSFKGDLESFDFASESGNSGFDTFGSMSDDGSRSVGFGNRATDRTLLKTAARGNADISGEADSLGFDGFCISHGKEQATSFALDDSNDLNSSTGTWKKKKKKGIKGLFNKRLEI